MKKGLPDCKLHLSNISLVLYYMLYVIAMLYHIDFLRQTLFAAFPFSIT